MEKSKDISFSRGFFGTGIASIISVFALFLEMIIAVRFLSPNIYGIYVLTVVATNFVVMATDFGCKTAAIQMIASSAPTRQISIANSLLLFRCFVILMASILIFLIKPLVSKFLSLPEALSENTFLVILMFLTCSADETASSLLQGFHAFTSRAIAIIIRSILRPLISIIFLAVFKLGFSSLMYSWIISFGVSSVFQYVVLPIPKRFFFKWRVIIEIIRFGFPLQISRILWFVSGRASTVILGVLTGPASVAVFEVADRIPRALQVVSEAFLTVFFPTMTTLLSEKKVDEAELMLQRSLRLVSFFAAFVALISVLFSQDIITLIFSDKYKQSSSVFAVLMVAFQMGIIVQILGYTLTSAGFPGRSLVENSFRAAMTVLGNLMLVPYLRTLGASLATLTANYLATPVALLLLRRTGIQAKVGLFSKHCVLLGIYILLFWIIPIDNFVFKVFLILTFLFMNFIVRAFRTQDMSIILPESITERIGIIRKKSAKEPEPDRDR